MYKKKALILTFACLMPLNQALWAEETADSSDAAVTSEAQSPATPEEPLAQTEAIAVDMSESDAADESSATTEVSTVGTETVETSEATEIEDETAPETATETARPGIKKDSMRDHWKAREEQYQALRKRAEEAGVMLPERPPWRSEMSQLIRPGMEERMAHRQEMMSMTQEERDAYRQQRYQEMRARADEMGIEMPETPPWKARQQALDDEWAKHQKVIQGMTDEERAACHAMHRRHMGMMRGGGAGPGCAAMGHQGCGMYQGDYRPKMMPDYGSGYGPGYGYGVAPYAPQNFWDPNQ